MNISLGDIGRVAVTLGGSVVIVTDVDYGTAYVSFLDSDEEYTVWSDGKYSGLEETDKDIIQWLDF